MRIDTRPRKTNSPRPAWKVNAAYLQWLRGRRCACLGRNPDCDGKTQAAHGPDPATKGIGTKSVDDIAMPLSEVCHHAQHALGWQTFAKRFLAGADPRAMCIAYHGEWLRKRPEMREANG